MEAAGIIALVRATTSTCVQARALCLLWKDAPRDVFHLRDELETYQMFYESIQTGILDSSFLDTLLMSEQTAGATSCGTGTPNFGGNRQREILRGLLSKGKDVAESLEEILVELIGEGMKSGAAQDKAKCSSGTGPVESQGRLARRKKLLWFRRLDTVKGLREVLRDTTSNISLSLAILNVQVTAVMVKPKMEEFGHIVQQSESTIIQQLSETTKASRRTIERSLETSVAQLEKSIESHVNRQIQASRLAFPLNTNSEDNRGHTSESRHFRDTQLPQTLPWQGQSENDTNPGNRNSPVHPIPLQDRAGRSMIPPTNRLGCRCTCHLMAQGSVSRWEMPWLKHAFRAFGVFYTGYSFFPFANSAGRGKPNPCRSCWCANAGCSWFLVQYQPPVWLTRAVLSMYFLRHNRPELLIRINRLVDTISTPYRENVIALALNDDISGLKSLLTSRPSTVHDLQSSNGDTALIMAVGYSRVSVVGLLLNAGADPFHENSVRNSAGKFALTRSLMAAKNKSSPAHRIAAMMPMADVLEQQAFTLLHRATLGWLPIDLEVALRKPEFRANVGCRTTSGLTALHLAARFPVNGSEVQILLDAGEDPNSVAEESTGVTPLHSACLGGNVVGLEALLRAGASPQLSFNENILRDTLLHAVARSTPSSNSSRMVDLILQPKFKIDIDTPNSVEDTAAMLAVRFNSTVLRYLVRIGADITHPMDHDGDTALHNAVFSRSHDAIRILLGIDEETGPLGGVEDRYRCINPRRGWGILHFVASHGDIVIMNIFASCKMSGIPDPRTFRDCGGRTAMDIFNDRVGFKVMLFGPPLPWQATTLSSESEQLELDELVKAWKNLVLSVNIDPEETNLDKNPDDSGGRIRPEENGGTTGSDSDDEFFDAPEA